MKRYPLFPLIYHIDRRNEHAGTAAALLWVCLPFVPPLVGLAGLVATAWALVGDAGCDPYTSADARHATIAVVAFAGYLLWAFAASFARFEYMTEWEKANCGEVEG